MLVVHRTKKFLDRVRGPMAEPGDESTTALGNWYAIVLFWKPQVALFVNEATLLPVLMPLAPTVTLLDRLPSALTKVLEGHEIRRSFIDHEFTSMAEYRLAKTKSRSLLGSMNECAFLAEVHRGRGDTDELTALSLRLADTPCGPLYKRHVSPDRELTAFVTHYPN